MGLPDLLRLLGLGFQEITALSVVRVWVALHLMAVVYVSFWVQEDRGALLLAWRRVGLAH
jgi:hypothetical protein